MCGWFAYVYFHVPFSFLLKNIPTHFGTFPDLALLARTEQTGARALEVLPETDTHIFTNPHVA